MAEGMESVELAGDDTGNLLSFKLSDLSPLQYSDFGDFVNYLGVDIEEPSCLAAVAAHQAFAAPLPPNWSEQVDQETMRIYFYNAVTDASAWNHPQETPFREILEEVGRWSPETPTEAVVSAIDAHLREFRERAVISLDSWSGPYTAAPSECSPELTAEGEPGGEYYFNTQTRESCWEHPAIVWEYELYTRYIILYKCLVAHDRALARPVAPSDDSSSDPDSGDGGLLQPSRFGGVTALAHSFLSSLRLPLPQDGDAAPPAGRPSPSAPDPALSMRSESVYLTARSEVS